MLRIIKAITTIGCLTSLYVASVVAAPVEPKMRVLSAKYANVRTGELVPVGKKVHTMGVQFSNTDSMFGGTARLSLMDWGVSRISMTPNSDVTLSTYGYCLGGGRTSQFEVSGEVYFTTRPKTHQCTTVMVCLQRSQGCVELSSSIALLPLDKNAFLVAVGEGSVSGIKRLTKNRQVVVNQGQFTTVDANGDFSEPKPMNREFLVSAKPASKTLTTYEVPEGFSLKAGNLIGKSVTLPNGITPALVTPFTKEQPVSENGTNN